MQNQFYITTPIFYVNSIPHLGHAYTCVVTDAIARMARVAGKKVVFSTGTDEHGQKIEQSAKKNKVGIKDFVDNNANNFILLMKKLNISYDEFIRTTEERHKDGVLHAVHQMWQKGFLYFGKYSGWYSVTDEAFFKEEELSSEKKTPTGAQAEWIEEDSIFFALSKFEKKLINFYEQNPNLIFPSSMRKEVINFIKSGLEDISVSRTTLTWGIPIPSETIGNTTNHKQHLVYVWLDALMNYLSVIGYPSKNWQNVWPGIHIIGKDISRFHCIYWLAFLMSLDICPPKKIAIHGWWTQDGKKMSKSLGNVTDPNQIIDQFGCDYLRYFLLREMSFGQDCNFSFDNFKNRINAELINKIGNFIQRTIKLSVKLFGNVIPEISQEQIQQVYKQEIIEHCTSIKKLFSSTIQNLEYQQILDAIVTLSAQANKYLDDNKPWKQSAHQQQVKIVMYTSFEVIRHIGIYLQPFVPESANKILNYISCKMHERGLHNIDMQFALTPKQTIPSFKHSIFDPVY